MIVHVWHWCYIRLLKRWGDGPRGSKLMFNLRNCFNVFHGTPYTLYQTRCLWIFPPATHDSDAANQWNRSVSKWKLRTLVSYLFDVSHKSDTGHPDSHSYLSVHIAGEWDQINAIKQVLVRKDIWVMGYLDETNRRSRPEHKVGLFTNENGGIFPGSLEDPTIRLTEDTVAWVYNWHRMVFGKLSWHMVGRNSLPFAEHSRYGGFGERTDMKQTVTGHWDAACSEAPSIKFLSKYPGGTQLVHITMLV